MNARLPLADPVSRIAQAIARSVRPRRAMLVSEWAEKNLRLSTKNSAVPGAFRIARNKPLQEPMDCMSVRSPVQSVVCCFPIQFGKSLIESAVVGYTMTEVGGPLMVCLPGEVSMKKFIAQKLNPLIEETASVQAVLSSVSSRDAKNTQDFKDFEGGQLYIEHAGNPKRLKSTSVRTLLVDEFTEFATSMTSGDDPVAMLDGRLSSFPTTHKAMYVSTPGIKGLCRTTEKFEDSDQRHYHMACPHCGERKAWIWDDLKWRTLHGTANGLMAWLVCPECSAEIDEHHKPAMLTGGSWVAHNPGHPKRGYRINCLYYAPGLGPRWSDLARMWLDAQGDPAKLKTFINDRLAEAWEDPSMRQLKQSLLRDRAEAYDLRVAPMGCCFVTAGVDTQDDRLEVQIVGWGRGMASWTLDYVVLPGDPARPQVWAALTALLNRPIQHAAGVQLRVAAVAIDGRGHRTPFVKQYVVDNQDSDTPVLRVMCIFGAKASNAPVLGRPKWEEIRADGKTEKRGIHTWQVGTVAIKHVLFRRIGADADIEEVADRMVHFSDQLEDKFFAGILSETFDPRLNRYVKKRSARNEPLDTWGYAYAAAHHPELRLHRYTRADWAEAEARIGEAKPEASTEKISSQPEQPALDKKAVEPSTARAQRRVSKSSYLSRRT